MENQQPKPKRKGLYDFRNIYTGSPETDPAVIEAKGRQKKQAEVALEYARKVAAQKKAAIEKASAKK